MLNSNLKSHKYIETMKKILFQDLGFKNKEILAIGAGGFVFSAESDFGNKITYIDIDKDIKKIAQKHFIKKIHGDFVHGDARSFLRHQHQRYDAIVSDVYRSLDTIPFYLLSTQYFKSVKDALKNNGVALFNIIANPTLSDTFSRTVNNTILHVFSSCMIIPQRYVNDVTNIIYVCRKTPLADKSPSIYTDDKNTASIDFYGI